MYITVRLRPITALVLFTRGQCSSIGSKYLNKLTVCTVRALQNCLPTILKGTIAVISSKTPEASLWSICPSFFCD
ncbi:hypothetical protein BDV96DRAFT_591545 [Lophiotrema nucula]|uniref:Uncharacterized protein n=1 Tax=Lophiotrema nucula TaxID=690887 RepID=A0A6A5YFF6_9PLEO|nr:hypothetical protein BDV96DRAFT_591545 [Lophiotrema nucula]